MRERIRWSGYIVTDKFTIIMHEICVCKLKAKREVGKRAKRGRAEFVKKIQSG